jgi:putative aminopeptidase FrvX
MKILSELCSVPTAPFVEDRVVAYAEAFVKARPRLKLSRDRYGNLLIELPSKKSGKKLPRWVFTAHMDHPGMVSKAMLDSKTVDADFRGWVLAKLAQGAAVRFFDGDKEIPGKIIHVTEDPSADRGGRAIRVRIRVKEPVSPNVPGMLDQGVGRIKGNKFYSRVCDDLAGAAAALAMLHELASAPPLPSPVGVLLTRAEEEGFVGAIAACLRPELLRKSDRLIAIECSSMQPYAPQGAGPIIRVGDRTSIFNSALTYFLTQQAEELKRLDKSFQYQRSLMPGGTCEATVYDIYGYHAAALCVALGNYHNMDKDRQKIGPEYVHVGDWRNMVKLFVSIARSGHLYTGDHTALRQRVEKRFAGVKHLL